MQNANEFRAAELLATLQSRTSSIQTRIAQIKHAWALVKQHADKGNPVKLGREVETVDQQGLTRQQLQVRQREGLITFDSVRLRFYTLVLNNFEEQYLLRANLEEAIKYWQTMNSQTFDRWLKGSLAAAIVHGGSVLKYIRPDVDLELCTRGVEDLAGRMVQDAFESLVQMLEAANFAPSRNEFLHRSLRETYPLEDVCAAELGGYDCSRNRYEDLRKVFSIEGRHLDPAKHPNLSALVHTMEELDEFCNRTKKAYEECQTARGEVNEGPYGLRLAEALQTGAVTNRDDQEKQAERRLVYETKRCALLAAIAATEDQRRKLKEVFINAVAETRTLIAEHGGTCDGELRTRRAVLNCLAVDKHLRVVGNRLSCFLECYRSDITEGWAGESVGQQVAELGRTVFQMSV